MFAKHLRALGNEYRAKYLNSNDEADKTPYAEDWRDQHPQEGSALGGPYIAVHMRRGDFAYSRKDTIPAIEQYAKNAENMLKKYKLKKIYLATDGTEEGEFFYQFYLNISKLSNNKKLWLLLWLLFLRD